MGTKYVHPIQDIVSYYNSLLLRIIADSLFFNLKVNFTDPLSIDDLTSHLCSLFTIHYNDLPIE